MKTYLFDWGDTLMMDFPEYEGKMCHWPKVKTVEHAKEVLKRLSEKHPVYIVTNAQSSSVKDIEMAFHRVGLNQYIKGYFCMENLGVGKGSSAFFTAVLNQLDVNADQVIMVGDNLANDILPAVELGIEAIWFSSNGLIKEPMAPYRHINSLLSLI